VRATSGITPEARIRRFERKEVVALLFNVPTSGALKERKKVGQKFRLQRSKDVVRMLLINLEIKGGGGGGEARRDN